MENKTKRIGVEEEVTSKRQKTDDLALRVNINEAYTEPAFMKSFSESFNQKTEATFENGSKIISEPFTCCSLPDFIQPNDFIDELKNEIDEIEVQVTLTDLFQFKQSKGLSSFSSPSISILIKLLEGKCKEWMKTVTNIELSDKVDVSCSCYTYTDHLLCHDDESAGRRIAFIYYLVPEWEEKYGGTLDLFNVVKGDPSEVVTSFVPKWNNLIFFEVSPISYHRVSEILAFKSRTSISGWFHGPPVKRSILPIEKILFEPPTTIPVDIKQWINPTYLHPETQLDIRESFEESSEIELMDFFQKEKYEEVCQALNDSSLEWRQIGPPSRRKYDEIPNITQVSPVIQECYALFSSEPFLLILSNLTGLRLHPASAENSAKMAEINSSVRRWSHGAYTLLNDQLFSTFATLNAALCFNCADWEVEYGGYTSYVAKGEKEELLRVDPKPNTLALVYITEGTSNFVKYLNCRTIEHSNPCFQDIFSVYKENE